MTLKVILVVIVVSLLGLNILNSSITYKDVPIPHLKKASELRTLVEDIIRSEGFSYGEIKVKRTGMDYAEMTMNDNYTEDDSIMAEQFYIKMHRKQYQYNSE